LRQVSPDGLKLDASRNPKDKPAIALQSALSVSAVYPHQSQRTDFIVTIGERSKDFRFPPETDLSSVPERKVQVP
jgi:hypothetical protein